MIGWVTFGNAAVVVVGIVVVGGGGVVFIGVVVGVGVSCCCIARRFAMNLLNRSFLHSSLRCIAARSTGRRSAAIVVVNIVIIDGSIRIVGVVECVVGGRKSYCCFARRVVRNELDLMALSAIARWIAARFTGCSLLLLLGKWVFILELAALRNISSQCCQQINCLLMISL